MQGVHFREQNDILGNIALGKGIRRGTPAISDPPVLPVLADQAGYLGRDNPLIFSRKILTAPRSALPIVW